MTFAEKKLGLDGEARQLSRNAWVALFLIALLAMLPGFFNIPTMDRDEARYSQASRQMMETGDYVDIRFQDQARHVKPAGIYWMQVVTTAPFGGTEAPQWAHRLPSLIGCLLAVWMTAWLGARIGGARVGFAAGVLVAVGLLISVEARTAKTDAMLLASITLAQLALYFIFHPPSDTDEKKFVGWPLVFWLAHGAGLMIKGPIITLVSAATILPLCLWMRDWSVLRRLQLFKGLLAMLLVVMPWLITITIQTNGAFIEESIGHALLGKVSKGDDSHGAPPGYHTIALLLTMWPGIVLLVLAGAYAWVQRAQPVVRFLICWIVPTWIIFELVATKLPHYVLPVFPAIAILAGLALHDATTLLAGKRAKVFHWILFALFAVITAVLGILPYYLVTEVGASAAPAASIIVVIAALVVIAAGFFLALRPSLERLLPLAGAGILFYVAFYQLTFPAFDEFWLTRGLARHTDQITGCEDIAFATMGYREPSVVFTFGTNTLLASDADSVAHLQGNPSCGLIAVSQKEQKAFLQMSDAAGLSLKTLGDVKGFNYVKGDELAMTFYADAASPLRYAAP